MTTNPSGKLPSRRTLLRNGAIGFAAAFQGLNAHAEYLGNGQARIPNYGPLRSIKDLRTGLKLLRLPVDFQYVSFGWRDDPLTDSDGVTPSSHDGMGVVDTDADGIVTLIRNHELRNSGSSFGTPEILYDPRGRGGATRLRFDTHCGEWLSSEVVLAGTAANCAGGVTPRGSWLTCEEEISGPPQGYDHTHGWVFEVPAQGMATPVPLRDMGRFKHEAVCVDVQTGYVFETEDDRYTSGFYRFRPGRRGSALALAGGGILEMLKVKGVPNADLMLINTGETFEVEWVPIDDPQLGLQSGVGPYGSIDGQTTSASGPFFQGYQEGGAQFRRLEGCWFDDFDRLIYFTDTEGGFPRQGAVWCYDPSLETLRAVYVSPGPGTLDNPDNITVSPRGGLLLCEDGGQSRERMHALTPQGQLSLFAQNDVVLNGEVNGISGNFRGAEWCGATFDPSGRWLFVNIYSPGITFAITGPWSRGPL